MTKPVQLHIRAYFRMCKNKLTWFRRTGQCSNQCSSSWCRCLANCSSHAHNRSPIFLSVSEFQGLTRRTLNPRDAHFICLNFLSKCVAYFDRKGDSRVERGAFGGNVSGGRGRDATTHVRAIQFDRRFIKFSVCQNGEHPAHVEPVREALVADFTLAPSPSTLLTWPQKFDFFSGGWQSKSNADL